MNSKIFNLNWEKFNYKDPEQRKSLAGALQYFCALPNKYVHERFAKVEEFIKAHKKVQEFTLMSDGWVNEKAIDIVEKFHLLTDYDNGYEQIFDVRDYSGTKASGFDIAAVRSGLTFKEIKEGEKLKVYQMTGAKVRVYFCYYGGALGWHRRLFEDGDWWTIEDNAIEFRNKAYSHRAGVYYALLEAAANAKGCCNSADTDTPEELATAINFAATNILENVANRGYNLNPTTTQFIVLAPLRARARVRYALNQHVMDFNLNGEKVIDYNFKQITSMMLTDQNRILVILPGRTLKIGYRMDLTLFDDFDILSYTDTVAGWMRHGGCIGDIDQINCIDLAVESGSCPAPSFDPQVTCGTVNIGSGLDNLQHAEPL